MEQVDIPYLLQTIGRLHVTVQVLEEQLAEKEQQEQARQESMSMKNGDLDADRLSQDVHHASP